MPRFVPRVLPEPYWQSADGFATVYSGDCYDVMAGMKTGSVGAVITDPPFSARTHCGHNASARGALGQGHDESDRKALGYAAWSEDDVVKYIPEMCRVADGWVVVMTDHTLAPVISKALESCGRYVFAPLPFFHPGSRVRLSGDGPSSWTDWIIVGRTAKQRRWGTLPGGYLAGKGWKDKLHMGGKPTELMRALVRDYSRKGDVVLDPFAGSGTTGVAALASNRRAVLVETNPEYVSMCRARVNGLRRISQSVAPMKPGRLIS
jgi:site-specific DNA-methyltransferase (adenine-specific)